MRVEASATSAILPVTANRSSTGPGSLQNKRQRRMPARLAEQQLTPSPGSAEAGDRDVEDERWATASPPPMIQFKPYSKHPPGGPCVAE